MSESVASEVTQREMIRLFRKNGFKSEYVSFQHVTVSKKSLPKESKPLKLKENES